MNDQMSWELNKEHEMIDELTEEEAEAIRFNNEIARFDNYGNSVYYNYGEV